MMENILILKVILLIIAIILLIITSAFVIYSFVSDIKINKMITDAANRMNNIKDEVDNGEGREGH